MQRAVAHPFLRRLAKPLGFALALLALTFLLQITPHNHANGQDEAACRLCQVAHFGSTPVVSAVSLSAPLEVFGFVTPTVAVASFQATVSHATPRAPPAPQSL
jgi:hypothetical protein